MRLCWRRIVVHPKPRPANNPDAILISFVIPWVTR